MTVIPERLAQLDSIQLDVGPHKSFRQGHCAEEVVAWLAGEEHTDAPLCVSSILREFTVILNDDLPFTPRQLIKPYLPGQVGTAGDGKDEARGYLALDWLVRTYTSAWFEAAGLADASTLRGLSRIIDADTAADAALVIYAAKLTAYGAKNSCTSGINDSAWDAALTATCAAGGRAATTVALDNSSAYIARYAGIYAAYVAAATVHTTFPLDALQPTVEFLQQSALELLGRMTDPEVL